MLYHKGLQNIMSNVLELDQVYGYIIILIKWYLPRLANGLERSGNSTEFSSDPNEGSMTLSSSPI